MAHFRAKLASIGVTASVLSLMATGVASAHVVVRPGEAVTAGFQAFTMGVPNERDTDTTELKLTMPAGLKYVSPTQKPGWQIDVEKDGTGEDAVVKSITWSGGSVGVGFRDDFTFSAQVPAKATELQWKAYQTYADGTVVSWDQPASATKEEGGTSGPFSVTKVVATTQTDADIKKAQSAAADAKSAADTALYIGIAGVALGLAGIYLATRKK
jgi:uncharacterized protein YcnI